MICFYAHRLVSPHMYFHLKGIDKWCFHTNAIYTHTKVYHVHRTIRCTLSYLAQRIPNYRIRVFNWVIVNSLIRTWRNWRTLAISLKQKFNWDSSGYPNYCEKVVHMLWSQNWEIEISLTDRGPLSEQAALFRFFRGIATFITSFLD